MAATIRFPDGAEATLIDGEGTWICKDQTTAELLKLKTEDFLDEEAPFFLDCIGELAEAMAGKLGAVVIHKDPFNSKIPPGAVG
jgi:hypothetical protein